MTGMRPLLLALALLAVVVPAARAEEKSRGLRTPHRDPFPYRRGRRSAYEKAKDLRQQADRLRTRASALNARAASMWDHGNYDESNDLEEQANELTAQQRRLEARARALELSGDESDADIPVLGDGQ